MPTPKKRSRKKREWLGWATIDDAGIISFVHLSRNRLREMALLSGHGNDTFVRVKITPIE